MEGVTLQDVLTLKELSLEHDPATPDLQELGDEEEAGSSSLTPDRQEQQQELAAAHNSDGFVFGGEGNADTSKTTTTKTGHPTPYYTENDYLFTPTQLLPA